MTISVVLNFSLCCFAFIVDSLLSVIRNQDLKFGASASASAAYAAPHLIDKVSSDAQPQA